VLTKSSESGGTFTSDLLVISRWTFTNRNPNGPAALFSPVRTDSLHGTGSFQLATGVPALSPWGIGTIVLILLIGGAVLLYRRASILAT
jgi:hypothetical protein